MVLLEAMTTTAAQLSFFFFLIQNTSLVLFEVVIQLFFLSFLWGFFFFRELFDKYQETWSVLYLMNNKTLTESLKNIKKIQSRWLKECFLSRCRDNVIPFFQAIDIFPFLLPTFLSWALVADFPPDLFQNSLFKLVREMKHMGDQDKRE